MRRINSVEDEMQGLVTFELRNGEFLRVSTYDVRELGPAELLRRYGRDDQIPTERLPVIQDGRRIGTMAPDFDPLFTKVPNFFYEIRPGDFRLEKEQWIADRMLGPGDLAAIPGFKWDDPEQQAQSDKDAKWERDFLRKVVLGTQ